MQGEHAALPLLDSSRIWLPGLVERIASFMLSNEVPCNLRLVNKATAALFRGRPEYTTVRLSQPVPHHAFVRCWGAPGATRSLNLLQRHALVQLTAASGSVSNLAVAIAVVGGKEVAQKASALCAAAQAGKPDVCRWILQQGYCLEQKGVAMKEAAKAGQQETVEYLLANGACWDWAFPRMAALGGHPVLVDWLLLHRPDEEGLPVYDVGWLLVYAAEGCSLAALQALHSRVVDSVLGAEAPLERVTWFSRALEAAARSPTSDWQAKVEWLEAAEPEIRASALRVCDAAVKYPDAVDRLRWLRQRGYRMSRDTARQAANAGSVAALEYVLAGGVAWANEEDDEEEERSVGWVARCGHLEVLKLLHARGCLRHIVAMVENAAGGGHLRVLVWAAEELGADLRDVPHLLAAAASSGSVELLAWLHERGCGWDGGTFAAAAGSGCEAALEWLAERGCPMGADGAPYIYASRGHAPDPPTLRCLQRLGCPWGPVGSVFNRCLEMGLDQPVLCCLLEAGCPVDWEAAVATSKSRFCSHIVRWWVEEWRQLHTQQLRQQGQQS